MKDLHLLNIREHFVTCQGYKHMMDYTEVELDCWQHHKGDREVYKLTPWES